MKKELNFLAKTQSFPETQKTFVKKLKIPQILANIFVNDYNSTSAFIRWECNKAFWHVFVALSGCSNVKTHEFLKNSIKFCQKTQF